LGYAAVAGHPVRGMDFFRARWLFELAIIHRAWTTFNESDPWYTREQVERLLVRALADLP
jgi:hypothetical protein